MTADAKLLVSREWIEHLANTPIRRDRAAEDLARVQVDAIKLLNEPDLYVQAGQWIALAERMPPDLTPVLAYRPGFMPIGIGEVLHRDDGVSWTFNGTTGHEKYFPKLAFTHWMPLPDAPASISSRPVSAEGTDER